MPRDRDDFDDDYPRRSAKAGVTGAHVVLAGVLAGLVAALVGGGIWLASKERRPQPLDYESTDAFKLSDGARKLADNLEAALPQRRNPADDDN